MGFGCFDYFLDAEEVGSSILPAPTSETSCSGREDQVIDAFWSTHLRRRLLTVDHQYASVRDVLANI